MFALFWRVKFSVFNGIKTKAIVLRFYGFGWGAAQVIGIFLSLLLIIIWANNNSLYVLAIVVSPQDISIINIKWHIMI
jgi:hypothetical protein